MGSNLYLCVGWRDGRIVSLELVQITDDKIKFICSVYAIYNLDVAGPVQ